MGKRRAIVGGAHGKVFFRKMGKARFGYHELLSEGKSHGPAQRHD